MSIRTKLALVLSAGIAAATAAAGMGFVQLQRSALRGAEEEKTRLLMESVGRISGESLLAGDPLMLLDYLAFLRRDRPEVHHCRVRLGGGWQDVGGKAPPQPPGGTVMRAVSTPAPDADRRRGLPAVSVEVYFSSRVLADRERAAFEAMVRNVSRSGGIVVLAGLLLSILLSRTMTRRLVRIEGTLEAIGKGRLGEVADAGGSDEIARLARGVNEMSEKLKELEQMKKTFIASVTHELRSPLGAIESQVKAMLFDPPATEEEGRRSLERIRKNATRLEHFVANLLEMSKIERGKLDYRPRPADLGSIVEDTALFLEPWAKEAGLSITTDVEPGLPTVRIDPDLIAQVLTNFVSNAVKFTRPGGRIRVTARRTPVGTPGPPGVECAVKDTGVGIPAEALGSIFSPFERVRNPIRATGAGLGLAISKSIIETHGGTIGVESKVGVGSRFRFLLPLKPVRRR
ncbi:MAG: HAMP domain-containing sensor histidine kinase [Elusimicrobiota bacterium]